MLIHQFQEWQEEDPGSDMAEEAEDINRVAASRGYLDPWPPVRESTCWAIRGRGWQWSPWPAPFIPGAAISGPCRTENLGLEKIVANVISNSNIRVLIICGAESKGHLPGNTLIALHKNGIDERGRIIGSKGAIPFIQNLPAQAIERFARQVELVERIGLEDREEIERLISQYEQISTPFPEEPYQVIERKAARQEMVSVDSDLFFGAGSAWRPADGWSHPGYEICSVSRMGNR